MRLVNRQTTDDPKNVFRLRTQQTARGLHKWLFSSSLAAVFSRYEMNVQDTFFRFDSPPAKRLFYVESRDDQFYCPRAALDDDDGRSLPLPAKEKKTTFATPIHREARRMCMLSHKSRRRRWLGVRVLSEPEFAIRMASASTPRGTDRPSDCDCDSEKNAYSAFDPFHPSSVALPGSLSAAGCIRPEMCRLPISTLFRCQRPNAS